MPWTYNQSHYWSKLPSWRDMLTWRREEDTGSTSAETEEPEAGLPGPAIEPPKDDTEEPEVSLPEPPKDDTEEPEVDLPEPPKDGTEEPEVDLPEPPKDDTEEPEVSLPEPPEDDTEEPEVDLPEPGANNGPLTEPVSLIRGATTAVDGGRVTVFAVETAKTVAAVEITDGPAQGHVTVNPDNTLALVLSGSDFSGALSFGFDITYADGSTEARSAALSVAAPEQEAGWGAGKHYMLETDARDGLIVETGDTHRKVYVSGSDDALTAADIAAREGVSEGTVTGKWLLDHPEYGGSEDMALASDIGMDVWYALTPIQPIPVVASHWLMFEKGYSYENAGRLINPGTSGESPLHPLYISSWGTGDRPVLTDPIKIYQLESRNIVIDDVAPEGGITHLGGDNIIVTDSTFTGLGLNIQKVDGVTLRGSDLAYIANGQIVDGAWTGFGGVGIFAHASDGLLLEGNTFHHNGWEDGYAPDASADGGIPPSMFSHNVYLQNTTTDATFRDNISSQAASIGAQIRGGGFVEDNVFLDNNVAVNVLGGVYEGDGPIGNYTFFTDNLITSGGHKEWTHGANGGRTLGLADKGYDTTFLNNIIAHLADPDNPAEFAEKVTTNQPFTSINGIAYDDTIIYNWLGNGQTWNLVSDNGRVTDTDLADQTTIQRFAAQVLGQDKASISDLMGAILAGEAEVTADDIIAYFQNGFGVEAGGNGSATSHRFIPNALADGIRWDNRINWNNEELPDAGDSVDLGGNHVQYGGTTQLANLDLGGGALHVNSGRLSVDGALTTEGTASLIQTLNAGQFWTDGYAGNPLLTIEVDGGRFANTGDITGQTLLQAGGGQTLLATAGASYTLTGGSRLILDGSDGRVGFDGAGGGQAELRMQNGSTLVFKGDAGGFSTIEEFRSGAWDQAGSPVSSSVTLDGTLKIDLSGYGGGTGSHRLIEVDELLGQLDTIEFVGLGNSLDAELVIDYATDTVRLDISAGNGRNSTDIIDGSGPAPGPSVGPTDPAPTEDTGLPTEDPIWMV